MSVYAVDFGGTLAITKSHEIIAPNYKMLAGIKLLKANGHKIILWSCRVGKDLDDAVQWCREQGLEFDAINSSLPEHIARFGSDPRKVLADYYIDDKSVPFGDVEAIVDTAEIIVGSYRVSAGRHPYQQ